MILTCPECATRYQADAAKFPPGGRKVKCAKCGHAWFQEAPAAAPVHGAEPAAVVAEPGIVEPAPSALPEPPRPVVEEAPRVAVYTPEPAIPKQAPRSRIVPSSIDASRDPSPWSGRLGLIFGWLLLAALILGVGFIVIRYRQTVVTAWPQTASFYAAIGKPVNPRGIDFKDVSYRREKQDGQSVLAITGKLVNVSGREKPVPQIRAALTDKSGRELYHWTFNAGVPMMKPDQTVKFLTRISSPPPGARHLEVRFVKDGE